MDLWGVNIFFSLLGLWMVVYGDKIATAIIERLKKGEKMTDEDLNYSSVPLKFVGKMECRAFGSHNKDHALIKQLGEALKNHCWPNTRDQFDEAYHAALDAYNNYLREREG